MKHIFIFVFVFTLFSVNCSKAQLFSISADNYQLRLTIDPKQGNKTEIEMADLSTVPIAWTSSAVLLPVDYNVGDLYTHAENLLLSIRAVGALTNSEKSNFKAFIYKTYTALHSPQPIKGKTPAGVVIVPEEEINVYFGTQRYSAPNLALSKTVLSIPGSNNTFRLKIKDVRFLISDNFITDLTVVGDLLEYDNTMTLIRNHGDIATQNLRYNVPLKLKAKGNKNAYNKKDYLELETSSGLFLIILIEDVFKYRPYTSTGAHAPRVLDKEFSLTPRKSEILYKRGINQYLNITAFSGILHSTIKDEVLQGGDKKNKAILFTSFSSKVPLNLYNRRAWLWFPSVETEIAVDLLDGISGKSDFYELNMRPDSILYVDMFDLVRHRNAYLNLMITPLSIEIKTANVNFELSAGINVFRASYQKTFVDTTSTPDLIEKFDLYSFAPEVRVLFTWKPQANLGMDFGVSINRLALVNSDNSIPRVIESAGIYTTNANGGQTKEFRPMNAAYRYLGKMEFNAYYQPTTDDKWKGGLFFKIETYSSFNSSSNFNIMATAGVATNLDAYLSK